MNSNVLPSSTAGSYRPGLTKETSTLCAFEALDSVTRGDNRLRCQIIRMYLRISGLVINSLPKQYAAEHYPDLHELLHKFSYAVDTFEIHRLAAPIEEILNDGTKLKADYVDALISEIRYLIIRSREEMCEKLKMCLSSLAAAPEGMELLNERSIRIS